MPIKTNDIVVCNTCGTVSEAKRRGSGCMELFLWLVLLWPIAVIYSIWRSGGGKCSACGSTALLPVTAPKVQATVNTEVSGTGKINDMVAQINARKDQQREKDAAIWRVIFWVVGSIFIFGVVSTIVGPDQQDIAIGIIVALAVFIYCLRRAKSKKDCMAPLQEDV